MITNLENTTRAILAEIEAFDALCQSAEYTDTGDVWELLYRWRNALRAELSSTQQLTPRQIHRDRGGYQ